MEGEIVDEESLGVADEDLDRLGGRTVSDHLVYCLHGTNGKMKVQLWVGNSILCGLIDTGAHISLVNKNVVQELGFQGFRMTKIEIDVKIQGIGGEHVMAWE